MMRWLLLLFVLFVLVACDDDSSSGNNDNNQTPQCGNGVIEGTEVCDGTALGDHTCATELSGYTGDGQVTCNTDCTLNLDDCTSDECGDGVVTGSEVCDGTDLAGATCETVGEFGGGTLACNEACTLDVAGCDPICSLDMFAGCDAFGENLCCDHNDLPSICLFTGEAGYCMQTCTEGPECGYMLGCISAGARNVCFMNYCGEGNGATPVNTPCSFEAGRDGYCVPQGYAMDDKGLCIEDGTAQHGDACVNDPEDPWFAKVLTAEDRGKICARGFCSTDTEAGEINGTCLSLCDPVAVYEGTATNSATGLWVSADTCPEGSNCYNVAHIDFDATLENGDPNPNVLFRTPDVGVCYPREAGVTDYGIITCDLLTGRQLTNGEQCPDLPIDLMGVPISDTPSTCQAVSTGSLIGVCAYVEEEGNRRALGEACDPGHTMYFGLLTAGECAAGTLCSAADPFHVTDWSSYDTACMQPCDATAGHEGNPACEGITDATGLPTVCLSMSRYFTADHELPARLDADGNPETEASPTPLGFCVPSL